MSSDWLYLFSSDRSPLYEQDILNVLAAPSGSIYTFRYDERYLEAGTRGEWGDLEGTTVVVLFSIQQEAQYHEPAFIPVRRGTVVRTRAVGSRLFVDFRLQGYIGLREPSDKRSDAYGAQVRRWSDEIRRLARATPYTASASLGKPLPHEPDTESIVFERISSYLSYTDSFRDARFVRFIRLTEVGDNSSTPLALNDDAGFELTAGHTYNLELVHSQRQELSAADNFVVNVDGTVVQILGRAGFKVASRYDSVTIQIHAAQATTLESHATLIIVEPVPPARGPEIEIPITVRPDEGRLVTTSVLQSLALLALVVPVTISIPAIWKIAIAVFAALFAVYMQLLSTQALKPGSLPGLSTASHADSQRSNDNPMTKQ